MSNENVIQIGPDPVEYKKGIDMTFPEAMAMVIEGKRVTRMEWGNTETHLRLDGGFLKIFKGDPSVGSALLVSDGDMFGIDWMEI
jgi:hypothetical protein